MARRRADRSTERGERRAEAAAVAACLTALRAPMVPARRRANLEKWRARIEQWIAEESSPIRQVELIQQRLDIDAQLAQIDQAARLPELEEAFVKVAASWTKRRRSARRRCVRSAYRPVRSPRLASEPGTSPDTHAERVRSCRNAITLASVMIDEIKLRAHARPLDEVPDDLAN